MNQSVLMNDTTAVRRSSSAATKLIPKNRFNQSSQQATPVSVFAATATAPAPTSASALPPSALFSDSEFNTLSYIPNINNTNTATTPTSTAAAPPITATATATTTTTATDPSSTDTIKYTVNRKVWDHAETILLINYRLNPVNIPSVLNKNLHRESKLSWARILSQLHSLNIDCNKQQIIDKWDNLVRSYKKRKSAELTNPTTLYTPEANEIYNLMDQKLITKSEPNTAINTEPDAELTEPENDTPAPTATAASAATNRTNAAIEAFTDIDSAAMAAAITNNENTIDPNTISTSATTTTKRRRTQSHSHSHSQHHQQQHQSQPQSQPSFQFQSPSQSQKQHQQQQSNLHSDSNFDSVDINLIDTIQNNIIQLTQSNKYLANRFTELVDKQQSELRQLLSQQQSIVSKQLDNQQLLIQLIGKLITNNQNNNSNSNNSNSNGN